jgi:general secretion pathway protein D
MNQLRYIFLLGSLLVSTSTLYSEPQKINLIPFSYTNEDIVNIISYLAGRLEKNILLPQGANALAVKVTYASNVEYTPLEAWDLLLSLLDVAGYSVIEKENTYQILKSNKEIAREGLPVYIGTGINSTRDADQRIMYVHYFTNMRVLNEGIGEVQEILKAILPDDAKYVADQSKNALIIAARAHDIYNMLDIIDELDKSEFKEKIDFVALRYAPARVVADLFNEHFLPQEDATAKYRLDTRKKGESSYFAPHTRIIAYERTNSLIIIGNEQGLARIKDFITHYIDVAPDAGESVLHVYRLQYLDAEEFVPVLQKIVEAAPGSTGQSRSEGKRPTGPERFFDEVIIAVDKPKNAQDIKYYGGNNLIIACRNDDWKIIQNLIEGLDIPQDQVFIEILIADLTVDDARTLGTIMRNPNIFPLFNDIALQSAQLSPGVRIDAPPVTPATNVNGDLLSVPPVTTAQAVIANMTPGSTAISFNDNNGQTWNVAQIMKLFRHSKIISHPHIVATHNKEAQFMTGQYRLIVGDVSGSIGSNTVIKNEPVTADLRVFVTPRISGENTVNLDIKIDIEEFLPGTSNARVTRTVKTNANIVSESILTLGGLIRTQSTQGLDQTPVLGDIPILGWFFKSRSSNLAKNNLTVFISPTIVHARLRKGIGEYTQDYIALSEQYSAESTLFDTIKDPITRLFFASSEDSYAHELGTFMEKDEFIREDTIIPVPLAQELDEAEEEEENEKQNTEVVRASSSTLIASNSSHAPKPVTARARRIRKKKEPMQPASAGKQAPPLITADKDSSYTRLKELLQEDDASPFASS